MDIIFLKEFTKELIRNSRPPELNFLDISPVLQTPPGREKTFGYDKPEEFRMFLQRKPVQIRYPHRELFQERVQQSQGRSFNQEISQTKQPTAEIPEGMHESIMTRDISQESVKKTQPPLLPAQKQAVLRQIQARSIHPQMRTMPVQQVQRQQMPQMQRQPMQARVEVSQLPVSQEQADIDLFKLNSLLKDPKVTKIECQGPGKILLVSSFGMTSQSSVSLTEEEIQAIIRAFSEATHIPLVGGTFKAIYKNLLMTAIITDYGSRFILERRYLNRIS